MNAYLSERFDSHVRKVHTQKLNQKTQAMLEKHAQELKIIALAHPPGISKRLNRLVDLLAKEAGRL